MVFYDKIEQSSKKRKRPIKAGEEKSGDLLRIELRLLTPEKVKSALGSNVWKKIDDNLIADYFYRCMSKWYVNHAQQWETQCRTRIKKRLQEAKNETSKNWHHLLLRRFKNEEIRTRIPVILDIEQVVDAIRDLQVPSYTKSHMVGVIRGAKCSEKDVFWKKDLDKLHEILDGFQTAHDAAQYSVGVDTSNML